MAFLTFAEEAEVAFEFNSTVNNYKNTLLDAIKAVPHQAGDPMKIRFTAGLDKGVEVIQRRDGER